MITREILGFADHDDQDRQLKVRLMERTVHGKLLLRNTQVFANDVFTQEDINKGDLR